MERTSSDFVLRNPEVIENWLSWVIHMTEDGLLVWRRAAGNPKRLMAYPSDRIRTPADFEMLIGRRFAGVTVGYPADAEETDHEMWLRLIDGVGERYYLEYRDAPEVLRQTMKAVHSLALGRCGQGQVTPLRLYG